NKKPCLVDSSNVGHCLFSGIIKPEYAEFVIKKLMSPEMFTGWGIRTLSSSAVRYNPMSYHNGSVWPHDTAMIAYGMAKYGYNNEVLKVVKGLFDASLFLELQRLPELFCGFTRRKGEGTTAYPVACSPQAWSVAAVFLLIEAMLQIEINATTKSILFKNPQLPDYIDHLKMQNIKLSTEQANINLHKYNNDVGINIINKPTDWMVLVYK
ncbi:MAG: amylo-alpha-1,6-glucosidase, partial [bacterium]